MKRSSNKKLLILVALVVTNLAWSVGYFSQKNLLHKTQAELATVIQNKKIVAFQRLFIDKVLKANGEVDFDTRVMLQNSVNDTEDNEVIVAWNNFLKSKTEAEGQTRVKELLSILAGKIYAN